MKKILIADDDNTSRFIISEILKMHNDNIVFETRDGEEALEVYDNVKPDFVILDSLMPKLGGFEVADIIKNKIPKPIIILVTAQNKSHIEKLISLHGIDHVISKPINPSDLMEFFKNNI